MSVKKHVKFLTVKYGRVSNLGNYETERIEVEVQVDAPHREAEMFEALKAAKATVNEVLGVEDDLTPEQIKRLQRSIERSKSRRGL